MKDTSQSNKQGIPGVVLVQQGGGTKVSETNAAAGPPKQRGVQTNRGEKPIICFHCGGNHPVIECNDIPLKNREKITMSNNKEWEKMIALRQTAHAAGKQQLKQQVDRRAHMQVSVKDINGRPPHQNNKEDRFVLLQSEEDNQLVVSQQQQERLNSTYLYLNLLYSFN